MTIEFSERKSIHGQWSSKFAFILAATGSAVGLGSIWRFPYMAGEHGGGAFVLVYLACVLLIGLPVMIAEVLLGRRGRRNPIQTIEFLAMEEGRLRLWRGIGFVSIFAGFLILSYYSVIGGWILAYTVRTAAGIFIDADADMVKNTFVALTTDAERLIAWHTIFMMITVGAIAKGVQAGLERFVRYLIPGVFVILLLLVAYAATTDYFMQGFLFLFVPDYTKLTATSVLNAMGMAFFSLSIGMGAYMMYGAYLPRNSSITQATFIVAFSHMLVAILAGLAIFPLVFANGIEPSEGMGLIFQALPLAFGKMQLGSLIGTLFFLLLLFASLASAIGLIEPSVAWLIEKCRFNRQQAAIVCGVGAWVVGLGTIFSFSLWSGYEWSFQLDLGRVQYTLFKEVSFFQAIVFLTCNIMLPLSGFLITIFVGYVMKREPFQSEMGSWKIVFNIWFFLLRYVAPVAILVVMFSALGVFEFH